MKTYLFIITDTNDKYELPLFVCDNCEEVAQRLGITQSAVKKRLRNTQKKCKYRIERIEV